MFKRLIVAAVMAGIATGVGVLVEELADLEDRQRQTRRKQNEETISNLVDEISELESKKPKEKTSMEKEVENMKKAETVDAISKIYASVPKELIEKYFDDNIEYNELVEVGHPITMTHKVRIPEAKSEEFIDICFNNNYEVKKYKNGRFNITHQIVQGNNAILFNILLMANQVYFIGGEYIEASLEI